MGRLGGAGGTGFPNAKGLSADDVQPKARSLNLQSTKCREMRNYPGTRPEKAGSRVAGDAVPAGGKLTCGLHLAETARGELQEGTGPAKSEAVSNPKTSACPRGVRGRASRERPLCWGSRGPPATLQQQQAEPHIQILVKITNWCAEQAEPSPLCNAGVRGRLVSGGCGLQRVLIPGPPLPKARPRGCGETDAGTRDQPLQQSYPPFPRSPLGPESRNPGQAAARQGPVAAGALLRALARSWAPSLPPTGPGTRGARICGPARTCSLSPFPLMLSQILRLFPFPLLPAGLYFLRSHLCGGRGGGDSPNNQIISLLPL